MIDNTIRGADTAADRYAAISRSNSRLASAINKALDLLYEHHAEAAEKVLIAALGATRADPDLPDFRRVYAVYLAALAYREQDQQFIGSTDAKVALFRVIDAARDATADSGAAVAETDQSLLSAPATPRIPDGPIDTGKKPRGFV